MNRVGKFQGNSAAGRLALFGLAWLLIVALLVPHMVAQIVWPPAVPFWQGFDTLNYWEAWRLGLYHGTPQLFGIGDFLYSPAFAQALWPLVLLPFWAFRLLWAVPAVLGYAWLIRPAPWPIRVPLAILACFAILVGNIEWALVLLVVFVDVAPWGWALPALTKVTPAVGALWYLGRGHWRSFGIAVGVSCTIAAVSFVLAPQLWADWLAVLRSQKPDASLLPVPSLAWRLPFAAALALLAGRQGSKLMLLASVALAQPDVVFTTLALLCAVPRVAGSQTGLGEDRP